MRYALLSDIHGNLEALESVVKDAEFHGCTAFACLGDIVGYSSKMYKESKSSECMSLVRKLNMRTVKGNMDECCAGNGPLEGFNSHAAEAIEWVRKQLSEEEKEWLHGLPLVLELENFIIVHATLYQPKTWEYVFDQMAAESSFRFQQRDVCFYGHTHVQVAFIRDHVVRGGSFQEVKVQKGKQYFVGVGSVGQPADGNPAPGYCIYDLEERRSMARRVK